MSTKKNNPAEEKQLSNTTNNKVDNMIYNMNLESVCGEEVVAQTAKVDQQVVKDLFNAFMNLPSSVIVKFRNENGYLKMVVNMTHREKFISNYETFADGKLVENMVGSMNGIKVASLEVYKADEHTLEASETDPRIEIFRQFINSPLSCRFDADFIAGNGDRYICATFRIGYRKEIKFCLKRTEEIEAIINEAMKAA